MTDKSFFIRPLDEQLSDMEEQLCSECADPLRGPEELEAGLCYDCIYQKDLEKSSERKHPDE